jgi:hypothetical protein
MSTTDGWTLLAEWAAGGLANAFASAMLNPVDVTKTRLQALQSQSPSSLRISTIVLSIYRESGLIGLWKPGLAASMTREMLYSGPRAGFYVPLRNTLQDLLHEEKNQNESLLVKLLSALTTGIYDKNAL